MSILRFVELTKSIRERTLAATCPASMLAGECACCHRAVAVVSWHAVPTGADLEVAQAEAAGVWRRLGLAARPRVIVGRDRTSFITAQCRTILRWAAEAPPLGSDYVMGTGRPLARCDFCLILDTEPSMFSFRMWPAGDVRLPSGETTQGAWAACPECSELVAAERWDDLVDRMARVQQNVAVTMLPPPAAKKDNDTGHDDVLRKSSRRSVEAFREARITDALG